MNKFFISNTVPNFINLDGYHNLNDLNNLIKIYTLIQNQKYLIKINFDNINLNEINNLNLQEEITEEEFLIQVKKTPEYKREMEVLNEIRTIKLKELNTKFNEAISNLKGEEIPEAEMQSWTRQEEEAQKYLNSSPRDPSVAPFLSSLAASRNIDLEFLCKKCLKKAELYAQCGAILIGRRQAYQTDIENINKPEELWALTFDFNLKAE